MSQENVDLVRRVYEAAARRDREAIFELYGADVELDNSQLGVVGLAGGGRVYRGHEGVRAFFHDWHEAWDVVVYDYDELIDVGADQVVSVVTRRGRGRVSGAEVEVRLALLWTIRAGKVRRVEWFASPEDALRAASGCDPTQTS